MHDWSKYQAQVFICVVVLGIVGIWVFVTNIIGLASGWKRLSKRFRLQQTYTGPKWRWQSAQMRGAASYNNCLIFGADSMGLFLSIIFLYRPGHPALFIPWNEVLVANNDWNSPGRMEIKLGQIEQVPFRIDSLQVSQLRNAAGGNWPGPRSA